MTNLRTRLSRLEKAHGKGQPTTFSLWMDDGEGGAICCATRERLSAEEWATREAAGGAVKIGGDGPDGDDEWSQIRRKRLQAVAALFRDLQPDLAEPLAQMIGRDAADNLIGAAEAGFAFLRSAAESLATGARKEIRNTWLTDQAQESLLDRMDDLRLRIDRLDARVRLAEERASPAEPEGS